MQKTWHASTTPAVAPRDKSPGYHWVERHAIDLGGKIYKLTTARPTVLFWGGEDWRDGYEVVSLTDIEWHYLQPVLKPMAADQMRRTMEDATVIISTLTAKMRGISMGPAMAEALQLLNERSDHIERLERRIEELEMADA